MQEFEKACPLCQKTVVRMERHLKREHNGISVEQLYVDVHHRSVWPLCECGCGTKLKFDSWSKGFNGKFIRGHGANATNDKAPEEFRRCPACTFTADSSSIVARHIEGQHGMTALEACIKFMHNGAHPTCACGCGEKLRWKGWGHGGFDKFLRGHFVKDASGTKKQASDHLTCPICDFSAKRARAVEMHIRKRHPNVDHMQLCIDSHHDGKRPLCECGCGQETLWYEWALGFARFLLGHNGSAVSDGAKAQRNKTLRDGYASGRIKVWSTGLTTETHPSLAKGAKTRSVTVKGQFERGERIAWSKGLTKETDERIKRQSERQKDMFARGELVMWTKGKTKETDPSVAAMAETLSGVVRRKRRKRRMDYYRSLGLSQREAESRLSKRLYVMCYRDARLGKCWRVPILERDGRKCQQCGSPDNLNVHHNKEFMATIISNILDGRDARMMTEEELFDVVDRVVNYHIENDVSGITLCSACHTREHARINSDRRHA